MLRLPEMPKPSSSKLLRLTLSLPLAALLATAGCESKGFIDPSEMGRFQKGDPLQVKILDQIDPTIEEPDPQFTRATPPTAEDLVVTKQDYRISPGDQLTVTVTDLTGQGLETVMTRTVSESGNVSLQLLRDPVPAEGLTEVQLQDEISRAYRDANIIQDAQVSVVVAQPQGNTFSILGAVTSPGRYPIIEADFRVLDALVLARDVTASTGIDYIYVIRKLEQNPPAGATEPARGNAPAAPTTPSRDPLAPRSEADEPASAMTPVALMQNQPSAPSANQPAATRAGETEGRYTVIDGQPVPANPSNAAQRTPAPRTAAPRAQAQPAPAAQQPAGSFQFNAPQEPTDRRVIKIPWEDLRNGNLRYNVVIKADDTIFIPQPVIGEYFMGGHVGAPGAYSLSARKVTLKQAVIAARMLDPIAIPQRTDIIRRIGQDHEMIVRVDLAKIFSGEQADIYLKPNDQVLVGTNAVAPFLLAVRNGFRVAYGFGFLYDRNFAYDNNNNNVR